MKTATKILVGCYRHWSTKTSAQKTQAYREEDEEAYLEVKAELERLASFRRRQDTPKAAITKDQQIIRELQSIFCNGRYHSWRSSSGL
jgi:hypothetical protein